MGPEHSETTQPDEKSKRALIDDLLKMKVPFQLYIKNGEVSVDFPKGRINTTNWKAPDLRKEKTPLHKAG